MSKVGLIIIINKFKAYFESKIETIECESILDAKKYLLNYLLTQFGKLNIDYPMDLNEFEYLWFGGDKYVNSNAFDYKIFTDKWEQPFERSDLYSEFLDLMLAYDSENPPDYSKLYGEPDPDFETDDKPDIEYNEETIELEKQLNEIMNNAKNLEIKDDVLIKQCKCEKCLETEANIEDKLSHHHGKDIML